MTATWYKKNVNVKNSQNSGEVSGMISDLLRVTVYPTVRAVLHSY